MPEWMTVAEAMAYLKVSRRTLSRWCEIGRLQFYELESGGGRRFKREDLDALLRRGASPADRLMAEAIEKATALGHRMEAPAGNLRTTTRYSTCSRCDMSVTVGQRTGNDGPLEVWGAASTTPCPAP